MLKDLAITAFEKAIDKTIEEKVDFVIIAGDLFNTSFPPVDQLKRTVTKLKQLKDNNIPVYFIAGSHDYSPSGKTMLDVLENAGLATNVCKGEIIDGKLKLQFTTDPKTGAKLTGILGKMGALEEKYFEQLDRNSLESESGHKIFLFHALLTELKPKSYEKVDSYAVSTLPKSFDYYAGGHPHFVLSEKMGEKGIIAYTGPLFPNSFSELEELKHGGFFIVEDQQSTRIPIKLHDVESWKLDCNKKVPEQIQAELKTLIEKAELKDKIITLRLSGTLESGKPSDINFKEIFDSIKEKGAYAILKNSSALTTKDFEEIKIEVAHKDQLEESLINEHISKDDVDHLDPIALSKKLLETLDNNKEEGETVYNFEKRLKEEVEKILH